MSARAGWLDRWEPEDAVFWRERGAAIAWRTLAVTTAGLVLSFATWFVVSALVVRLPGAGFPFTTMQLFWLAAMPGLAGGTFRLVHTFLVPILGTRNVITFTTFLKLVPCLGLAWAVATPGTTFGVFLFLAFLAGFGGGDFSSYMPSTSLFFPKRLQGTALGIQAGLGNFGVSLAQLLPPWIVGFSVFGPVGGAPQAFRKGAATGSIWLQNGTLVYVPFLLLVGVLAWAFLRSVPVKASFSEQLDLFRDKHTWFCTVTYVMTFGSFSGLSAAFPLLMKTLYGGFADAPDPLRYAFLGPLVGSAARVLSGFVADRVGGAVLTQLAGLGMMGTAAALVLGGFLAPASLASFPGFVGLFLLLFLLTGIGNASTFRQFPIVFSHSPRQGAQVLGFTAAVAAYGPFLFSALIGASVSATGSPVAFFAGLIAYCAVAVAINWWFYARKGCERPS
ncbi:NarK/NasA family nitrate transporter [Acidobacteria bacterium ACD]|nr:NarK/NasA family nitrate transporter [Acidobacteria bacterium ACD]